MALIKCPECGADISEKAERCPNCGNPNKVSTVVLAEKEKGFWSAGRTAIGIISMVLFPLITLQSCAAGINNALEENGATSGTSGFGTALFMLIGGIIGVCTRNSKSKIGAIITALFYWLGALMSYGENDTYGDLSLWCGLSFIFGIVFIICAIRTKKTK